ncbi:hypothetical protein BDR07DRAFT_1500443 [Suillus spraguei]|nr:hypothetical protein BDR07DRAFT_1500443 [Suillus spraguei]
MTTTLVDNQAISKPDMDDLTKFITRTSNYPVASGAFGSVYKWDYKCGGQEVFIELKTEKTEKSEERDRLGDDPSEPVSLVSLWMSNGTLRSHLSGKIREDKYLLLYNVADGLHYLHSESVVHGDLTSASPYAPGLPKMKHCI